MSVPFATSAVSIHRCADVDERACVHEEEKEEGEEKEKEEEEEEGEEEGGSWGDDVKEGGGMEVLSSKEGVEEDRDAFATDFTRQKDMRERERTNERRMKEHNNEGCKSCRFYLYFLYVSLYI